MINKKETNYSTKLNRGLVQLNRGLILKGGGK